MTKWGKKKKKEKRKGENKNLKEEKADSWAQSTVVPKLKAWLEQGYRNRS